MRQPICRRAHRTTLFELLCMLGRFQDPQISVFAIENVLEEFAAFGFECLAVWLPVRMKRLNICLNDWLCSLGLIHDWNTESGIWMDVKNNEEQR